MIASAALSCVPGAEREPPPPASRVASDSQVGRNLNSGSSEERVGLALQGLALTYERTLATIDSLVTVSARGSDPSTRVVVTVMLGARGAQVLASRFVPVDAGFPEASWLVVGNTRSRMLSITFRDDVNGYIGTSISMIALAELREIFRDDAPGVCTPASLLDVDNDSIPELLSYEAIGSVPDCAHECYDDVFSQFRIELAWPVLRWWDGREWRERSNAAQSFWVKMRDEFSQLRSEILVGKVIGCTAVATDLLPLLDLWIRRANDAAEGPFVGNGPG